MIYFFYILIALLILLLMITIHEFGHYTAAKLLGFGIVEFSIGVGPALLRRRRKNGEYFSIRALPLGGYCAFYNEEEQEEAKEEPKTVFEEETPAAPPDAKAETAVMENAIPFEKQSPWKRIIVMMSGAAFNLFSAFIFSFIYILVIGYSVPVVSQLSINPATGDAYAAQLEVGDRILAVDGTEVGVLHSFAELVADAELGEGVTLTVERHGVKTEVKIAKHQIAIDEDGQLVTVERFGFTQTNERVSLNALHAAGLSFPFTFKLSWAILGAFGRLITGQVPLSDITGPVGTITTIATYAELDWHYILLFLPLIASNLAIFNILPFPSLDGSRAIFAAIEWIRKKPIDKKIEGTVHAVGIMLLLAFVIVVDIIGFIAR